LVMTVLLCVALSASPQAQITTKKEKFSDFQTRTTKIVLTGRDFYDAALRDAARSTWTVSPFEFCDTSEFRTLRKDEDLYFLLTTQNDDAPGLLFLSLLKGGGDEVTDMVEAVRLPACGDADMSGRVTVYMPALLVTLQNYIDRATASGFSGIGKVTESLHKAAGKAVVFDPSDVAAWPDGLPSQLKVSEAADSLMTAEAAATLTSYTAKGNGYCYTMLFDTQTLAMHWFKKSRKEGFSAADIRKIGAAIR